ncbi:hypothetical protein J1N35_029317 [Gossypium stocksii]|uniref:Uncharacterized protein n=1 Tax=Gossypium stocksii TaxID=47602 RepID=A0A9D3ZTF4_9ROSI|nr:hypothetical protein J1N35_029317 [Gossypium stocksii]
MWFTKSRIRDINLETIEIYCDNQSAAAIAKNLVFHGKTKHFKIKCHFVREFEQSNEVKLVHYSSDDQLVDILTKPLGKMRFKRLRYDIEVHNIMANEECCEVAIHVIANSDHKVANSSKLVNLPRDTSSSKATSLTKVASSTKL